MSADRHTLWTEKYRPKNLDEYVFHDATQEQIIRGMLKDESIPHLLLSGIQGSGKTSLAKILISELDIDDSDVLLINASSENSVDVMRDKITSFVTSMAFGNFKVVILDEADYISLSGQAVMRNMMETYEDNARFILTCNYENKIQPAVKSRCQQFRFKAPDREFVTEFIAKILIDEGIKFRLPNLDRYVAVGYPDVRKIVNLIQMNSIDGTLIDGSTEKEVGDYKFELLDFVGRDKWNEARMTVCGNVAGEEWEDVYRFLYENLNTSPKFSDVNKWEAGIIIIADHLYKHGISADPEINAAAMFIRLTQV